MLPQRKSTKCLHTRWTSLLVVVLIVVCAKIVTVNGHGRLTNPASRSTMWRYGFDNPPNYNDHELFCGGLQRQINNGGKCGICGDAYDAKEKDNEIGGKYANGIIVRNYTVNAVIDIEVELTAYHKGYFIIEICPTNSKKREATDSCLEKHTLKTAENNSDKYFPPEKPGGVHKLKYVLPKNLECSFCVLRWTYVAGNNWGKCKNGTEGMGCGPQETFKACADVVITGKDGGVEFSNDIETNDILHRSNAAKFQLTYSVFFTTILIGLTIKSKVRY